MRRLLLILLALLLPSQGWAAVSFFWRAEGTTLSATDDLPAGDTSVTLNGTAAVNGTAALVGSNGVQLSAASDNARLDSNTTLIDPLVGSVAFWVRIQTWTNGASVFYVRGSNFAYNIELYMTGTDELRLHINEDGAGSTLDTTAANLVTGTTYFVTFSWDQPNSDRRIRVYDSSGSLIQQVEDTSTAFTAPVDLATSDGLRIGEARGFSGAAYMDNIFIGKAYTDADTFLTNRSITSYTSYGGGGGGGGITTTAPNFFRGRLRVNP
jgi:hypothetical protein